MRKRKRGPLPLPALILPSQPPTMSRFFKGEGSSSESESDQSSSEGSEVEEKKVKVVAPTRAAYDSSSDEDGAPVKRVVQSQQAKLAQEYDTLITKIKGHIKTNECTAFVGGNY